MDTDPVGLADVGQALQASLADVIAAYAECLRGDPTLPAIRTMGTPEIVDHHFTLLADIAQALVILGLAAPEAPELLRDGSAIQRIVAERHGLRRHDQRWSEAAISRGYDVLRAEVQRAVRRWLRVGAAAGADARAAAVDGDAAMRVLNGLIDKAEGESLRTWRRASAEGGRAEGDAK